MASRRRTSTPPSVETSGTSATASNTQRLLHGSQCGVPQQRHTERRRSAWYIDHHHHSAITERYFDRHTEDYADAVRRSSESRCARAPGQSDKTMHTVAISAGHSPPPELPATPPPRNRVLQGYDGPLRGLTPPKHRLRFTHCSISSCMNRFQTRLVNLVSTNQFPWYRTSPPRRRA